MLASDGRVLGALLELLTLMRPRSQRGVDVVRQVLVGTGGAVRPRARPVRVRLIGNGTRVRCIRMRRKSTKASLPRGRVPAVAVYMHTRMQPQWITWRTRLHMCLRKSEPG